MDNKHAMSSGECLISVIMSVYNESCDMLKLSLESLLYQTYSNLEFIIILDNPHNEDALSILLSFSKKDKRISIHQNETNIGLAKSLNLGIEMAKGEYIARMDADDISLPNRLEREVVFLESNNFDMVCSLVEKIDENGKVWDVLPPHSQSSSFFETLLPIQNVVVHPTVLMKTSCVRSLDGYRPFSSCQDYDLWLRMLTARYKIGIINEVLLQFRSRPDSISGSKHFSQILNEKYIRTLYKERVATGKDSFSEDALNFYLGSKGAFDFARCAKENFHFSKYSLGLKDLKGGNKLKGIWRILCSLNAITVRESIITSIKGRYNKSKFK